MNESSCWLLVLLAAIVVLWILGGDGLWELPR